MFSGLSAHIPEQAGECLQQWRSWCFCDGFDTAKLRPALTLYWVAAFLSPLSPAVGAAAVRLKQPSWNEWGVCVCSREREGGAVGVGEYEGRRGGGRVWTWGPLTRFRLFPINHQEIPWKSPCEKRSNERVENVFLARVPFTSLHVFVYWGGRVIFKRAFVFSRRTQSFQKFEQSHELLINLQ